MTVHLHMALYWDRLPLISRQLNSFTVGKPTNLGRWGLYMETNELLLASPGTDYNNSCVSIGGYLADGTKQSNLTVDNYNRRVGIGTTTPTTTLEVSGGITATGFIGGPRRVYNNDSTPPYGVVAHSSQLQFALSSTGPPLPSEVYMTIDVTGVTVKKRRCI